MTFTEPIVAGKKILQDVESENYEAGIEGWSIQRDGAAEFNGAIFRGTVEVAGSGNNRIRIIVQSGIPTVEFRNADGELFYLDVDNDSARWYPATAGNSRLIIHRDEGGKHGIVLRSDSTGAPSVLFNDDDGFIRRGSYSPWTENTWQPLATAGAWAGTVEYMILPHAEVMFRGSLAGGANVVGNPLLAALPAAIRPKQTHRFQCPQGTNNTTDGRIQIDALGNVVIAAVAGTASYWFDQVRYLLY